MVKFRSAGDDAAYEIAVGVTERRKPPSSSSRWSKPIRLPALRRLTAATRTRRTAGRSGITVARTDTEVAAAATSRPMPMRLRGQQGQSGQPRRSGHPRRFG
jgi:hypothetical protein